MEIRVSELSQGTVSLLLQSKTVHELLDNLIKSFEWLALAEIYKKGEYGWARVASSKNYDFKCIDNDLFENFLNNQSLHRIELASSLSIQKIDDNSPCFYMVSEIVTFDKSNVSLVLAGEKNVKQSFFESFIAQLNPILSNLHMLHNYAKHNEELALNYKRQTEALERSLNFFDSAGDAIFIHDLDGKFIDFNQQAIISLGYSRSELLTKKVKDIDLSVNHGLPLVKMLKDDIKPGQPKTIQSTHIRKDGSQFPVEVTVSSHSSNNFLAVARDISKRMQIRKTLEDTQVFLKNIIDLSDNILYVQDLEKDKIISGANKVNQYLGYPEGTIKKLDDFFPLFRDEEQQYIFEKYKQAIDSKNEEVIVYECQCKCFDGKWIWVKTSITIGERDDSGKASKLFISSADITQYKELEKSLIDNQQKYISLVENAFDAILVIDKTKMISFASAPVYKLFNYQVGDGKGLEIKSFVHHRDHVKLTKAWAFIISNPNTPYEIEAIRVKVKGEGYKWTKVTLNNLFQDPHVEGVVINISDISKEVQAKKETKKRESYYQSLVENSYDGIALFDKSSNILFISDSTKKLLGYEVTDIIEGSVIDFVHAEDIEEIHELVTNFFSQPFTSIDLPEYRLKGKDGSDIWVQNTLTNLIDDPNIGGVISNFKDITNKKQSEQNLFKLSNFDTHTGLPNRKFLLEELERHIINAQKTRSQLGLVIIDIDSLSEINTAHGHTVGDDVIIKIAEVIKGVVSPTEFVAKIGDDEFAIIFDKQSTYTVSRTTQAILESFSQLVDIGGSKIKVSLSAGVSTYPKDATSEIDMISCAETALKSAKKNLEPFAFYKNYDSEYTKYRLGLEKDLIEALNSDQLRMVYQPVIESKNGKIYCLEALVRWQHPIQGNIEPGLFVKIAEKSNLIAQLSQWVISSVIKQIALWNKSGLNPLIAINLSPLDIRRKNLNQYISKCLQDNKVSPSSILFEITESKELRDLKFAIAQMQDIYQSGIEFTLDDFGTGFSSISHLLNLPITGAKVDQSFVARVMDERGEEAKDFLYGVINLIKGSGLKTVVEGIETREQLEVISNIDGLFLQGYLISKPLEVERATEILISGIINIDQAG